MPVMNSRTDGFGDCTRADRCVFDRNCQLYTEFCAGFEPPPPPACASCHSPVRHAAARVTELNGEKPEEH